MKTNNRYNEINQSIQLEDSLKYDPLQNAEDLLGTKDKSDPNLMVLAMSLAIKNSNEQSHLLKESGDTGYHTSTDDFIDITESLGFNLLHEKSTSRKDKRSSDINKIETTTQYYYWHPEKFILVVFESYSDRESINSATMYYSIRFNTGADRFNLTSSGSFSDGVWCGDHDIRKGFIHKFNSLNDNGVFCKWADKDRFLWLLTYMETDGDFDSKEINRKVLKCFPDYVLDAMNISTIK